MNFIFQHSPPYGSHTFSISVAVLGFHWSKSSPADIWHPHVNSAYSCTSNARIYLSNFPPSRIWHKIILMWGGMHESRHAQLSQKDWILPAFSCWVPQAPSNELCFAKQLLPEGIAPKTKRSVSLSLAQGWKVMNKNLIYST